MHSTDTNLNNPTIVDQLQLDHPKNTTNHGTVTNMEFVGIKSEGITQAFYDLMNYHDQNTIYIISDAKDHRYYIGDLLIIPDFSDMNGKCYISIFNAYNGEYEISMFDNGIMIPLSIYPNAEYAINALNTYHGVISASKKNTMIYQLLYDYINHNISKIDAMIGILCISDKKAHPSFQLFLNNFKHTYPNVPVLFGSDNEYKSICDMMNEIIKVFNVYHDFIGAEYKKELSMKELEPIIIQFEDIIKYH